jgi:hypothetical protein
LFGCQGKGGKREEINFLIIWFFNFIVSFTSEIKICQNFLFEEIK